MWCTWASARISWPPRCAATGLMLARLNRKHSLYRNLARCDPRSAKLAREAEEDAYPRLAAPVDPACYQPLINPEKLTIRVFSCSISPVCMGKRRVVEQLSQLPPPWQTFVHYVTKLLIMITHQEVRHFMPCSITS